MMCLVFSCAILKTAIEEGKVGCTQPTCLPHNLEQPSSWSNLCLVMIHLYYTLKLGGAEHERL